MHAENEIVYLYLDDIIPNRFQPREVFDDKALKELAVSIKEHGIIQPIIVRNIGQKYEIIAGERRYKASALAGLTKIPAIVRDLDDKESSKVALLENLQRRDLNPVEEARTYQKILELDQLTQEQLAKTMGKSQSAVANKLRLLSLSEEVQNALLKEQISERHARTLLNVSDPREQQSLLKKIVETKMTVRELEKEIKGSGGDSESSNGSVPINNEPIDLNNVSMPTALDDLIAASKGESQVTKEPDKTEEVTNDVNDEFKLEPIAGTKDFDVEEKDANEPDFSSLKPISSGPTESYINYGEIDKDEINNENVSDFKPTGGFTSTTVDPDELKSNSFDIPVASSEKDGSLDGLLRIDENINQNKFITVPVQEPKPQQEMIENNALTNLFSTTPSPQPTEPAPSAYDSDEKDEDGLPMFSTIEPANVMPAAAETQPVITQGGNINLAIASIKNNIKEIEKSGFNVDAEEINLENSYQIIIKVSNRKE